MLKGFKPEIKLFLIVVLIAAVISVAGILLLRNDVRNQVSHTPVPAPSPQPQTTEGWQTYRSDEFGFEVRYPSGYEIRLSPGYKLSEFSACNQTRCTMFLAIYQVSLDLSTSGPYQSYRRVEAPDYLEGVFYYYSIDTRDPEINQILATFRFVK